MRRIFNITFSPTGGTKRVADCLCAAMGAEEIVNVDLCDRFFDAESVCLEKEDVCVVSVPSYAGRVPVTAAQRMCMISGNGAAAIAVCVYGNRAWEDTLIEIKDILEARGFVCAAAVAAIAEHSMLRQYAAARPDAEDRAELKEFAERINAVLETGAGELIVPGNRPYRQIGAFLKPVVNDACVSCGVCADMCPVGAIDAEQPNQTDFDKCISCTRCISICPYGARQLDENMLHAVEARIGRMMTGRKQNELFLAEK